MSPGLTADASFRWGCVDRPRVELRVFRCSRTAWQLFRGHHYLSADLARSARCYVAMICGEPVAFSSWIVRPYGPTTAHHEHRTVVLPDYQGLGIGNRLSEAVAQLLSERDGRKIFSTTSHPAMIHRRIRSPRWRMTRRPSMRFGRSRGGARNSSGRLTAAFQFVPEACSIDP